MSRLLASFRSATKTSLVLLCSSLIWTACSSDEVDDDQGAGGSGGTGEDAGGGGQGGEAGVEPVVFKVPVGGGKVSAKTLSGNTLEFEFPASAAGKEIKLSAGESSDLGWPVNKFSDVMHMEPDGLVFSDPVVVKHSKKNPLAFSHATKATKGKGEPLELSDDKKAHKVKHFSSIAYLNADEFCDEAIENQSLALELCYTTGTANRLLQLNCSSTETCYSISGYCCVEAGATTCSLGDPNLSISYFDAYDPNLQPYCEVAGTGGQGSGGASSAGGAPQGGQGGTAM